MDYKHAIDLKVETIFRTSDGYLSGSITYQNAKADIMEIMKNIRPAQLEKFLIRLEERKAEFNESIEIHKLNDLFRDYIPFSFFELQEGHPIRNYYEENIYLKRLLLMIDKLEGNDVLKDKWIEIYSSLNRYQVHIRRISNNFYPILRTKGLTSEIDTAERIGNSVCRDIEGNIKLLKNDEDYDFLCNQRTLVLKLMEYVDFEEKVLFRKALTRITLRDLKELKNLDDVFGYYFIDTPVDFRLSESEAGSHLEVIIPYVLESNSISLKYYTFSGELLLSMGNEGQEEDYQAIEELIRVMKEESQKTGIVEFKLNGKVYEASSTIVDGFGDIRGGILVIIKPINIKEDSCESYGAVQDKVIVEYDGEQSIQELFDIYPMFREEFYSLHEDLSGLRSHYGVQLLKEATIEMIAISIGTSTEVLLNRINALVEGYSK